ncbi:PREDICTED: heat shock factor protein 5, partial [Corvus brachyrhynchos]|uniref:heat shock factor protein 5 n=1 Tax=Corvus brachyrhynchos TaxID=85066 RepID=UPI00081642A2
MAELPLPAGLDARTFPAKLWRLANSPRVRSVRWDTQGRGLLIDRALFEQELLSPPGADGAGRERGAAVPDSFKATHFGSVVRQLNLYGFQKVLGCFGAAVPGDAGPIVHFQNPNFRRDRPDLLLRIKRLTRANRQRLAEGLEGSTRSQHPNRERPLLDFLAGHPPSAGETGWELRARGWRGLWPRALPVLGPLSAAAPGGTGAVLGQGSCAGRARQRCRL